MKKGIRFRLIFLLFSLFYILAFCYFYFIYVPLIKSFQMILIPILFIVLIVTSINKMWGILIFVFTFPLINNLPYFFGIDGSVPHAPTALVLFLVFFLGWLFHNSFSFSKLNFNHPIFKPLILCFLIIFLSGIITFFRYANFFPFLSDSINELVVNTSNVRAGGALMSDVFSSLNYLSGFLFFIIIFNSIKSKDFLKKLLIVLSFAILISLLFSVVQRYYSISLGNTSSWAEIDRINSTFKDPNSFGVILCASIPLLLGMSIYFRKYLKLYFLLLVIFSLLVFPSIGSRSGFLGLVGSLIAFFILILLSERKDLKKRIIQGIAFFFIIILISFSILFFFKGSNLYKRIGQSIDMLVGRESLNTIATRKIDLWYIASNMVKDYPLTGVGLGGYIVELPNYGELTELSFGQYSDSAENYFFQVGAELGLIGFFLMLWLFYEIIKLLWKGWKKCSADNNERFILIGLISGLVAIFINFFFHSYIGSYEVKYFLWLLLVLVFVFSQDKIKSSAKIKFDYKFKIIAVILPIFFGAFHLWNSTQSLSIENRTEKFGWNQNFGIYQLENDNRNFYFHWTKKISGIAEDLMGPTVVIPMMASHPDIKNNPVEVSIFLADHYFKRKKLIKKVVFEENIWVDFKYQIQDMSGNKIYFVFDANRVWRPLEYSGAPDPRSLAIALGRPWFKYPCELPEAKIRDIQRIPQKNWEGKFKNRLFNNDITKLKFEVRKRNIAIRLYLRGQKAFDIGPYIILRINNKIVGKTMLKTEEITSIVLFPEIDKGMHELSVEFTNDIYIPTEKQDRNVYLGDLEIIYLK